MNDVYYSNPYDKIVDYLFLGSRKAIEKEPEYFSLIVNCTKDIRVPENCNSFIRIPIDDSPDESENLIFFIKQTQVLEQIHEHIQNKEPVLVHCLAGAQRSCALVACYLIKYYDITPDAAINYIKNKRRIAFYEYVNLEEAIEIFYDELKDN